MTQKIVAITGASNGMGFEAAELLPNGVGKYTLGHAALKKFHNMRTTSKH